MLPAPVNGAAIYEKIYYTYFLVLYLILVLYSFFNLYLFFSFILYLFILLSKYYTYF